MFAHKPNTQINKLSENMFLIRYFGNLPLYNIHVTCMYGTLIMSIINNHYHVLFHFKISKKKKNNDFEVGLDFKKLNPFIKFPFLFY